MLNVVLAIAAIPVGAIGLPRSFKYGGKESADIRLSALVAAKGHIKRLANAKKITAKEAKSLLADVKMLHDANDDGWGRWKDWGALSRIVKTLTLHGAESATVEVKRQAVSAGESIRAAGGRVKKTYEDLRDRIGGQQ